MNLKEYAQYDAIALASLINKNEISAKELSDLAMQGIEKLNPTINAVVESYQPSPDKLKLTSYLTPLSGVPTLLKDTPIAKGVKAEYGSPLMKEYVTSQDSHIWQQLKKSGVMNMGRTHSSEFGIAAATESQAFGITRNPWDINLSTAGSSGGAAAAVAAGIVPFAHATDGGGAIRTPAAYCGLVGLKPSRGRVSCAPGSASGYNGLYCPFVITRSIRDTALLLDIVNGPVSGDYYQTPKPAQTFTDSLLSPLRPLRIALTTHSWSETPTDEALIKGTEQSAKLCELLGHQVEYATPHFDYEEFLAAQKIIWSVHIHDNIKRITQAFDSTPSLENLQTGTFALYEYGRQISAVQFVHSVSIYEQISRQIASFFEQYDILLTPTTATLPTPVGTLNPNQEGLTMPGVFKQLEKVETFTALFNCAGNPAISLPLQTSECGLPVGSQFIAGYGKDDLLLQLAAQLEKHTNWQTRKPSVHVSN
jgi:amidase